MNLCFFLAAGIGLNFVDAAISETQPQHTVKTQTEFCSNAL
jgi:hypothetical protein